MVAPQVAATDIAKFVEREPGCQGPLGLTHRLRLLRYEADDRFDPHYDRVVPDDKGESESLITVLLYLNDGGGVEFEGGETLFLDATDPQKSPVPVVPKTGRVVLFEDGLYHCGSPLGPNNTGKRRREYRPRVEGVVRWPSYGVIYGGQTLYSEGRVANQVSKGILYLEREFNHFIVFPDGLGHGLQAASLS